MFTLCLLTLQDVSLCLLILQDVSLCLLTLQDVSMCLLPLQDVSLCFANMYYYWVIKWGDTISLCFILVNGDDLISPERFTHYRYYTLISIQVAIAVLKLVFLRIGDRR